MPLSPPKPRARIALHQTSPDSVVQQYEVPRIKTISPLEREHPKLLVAAYCRVSTDMDCQKTSMEGQREFYEREITSNPDWSLAGIYLESGISGTKAETRPELQRLLSDCRKGLINLILTKSISRFARNTTDCLDMVRELTSLGVSIRFEKERIDTGKSEFLLTLLACFAENRVYLSGPAAYL